MYNMADGTPSLNSDCEIGIPLDYDISQALNSADFTIVTNGRGGRIEHEASGVVVDGQSFIAYHTSNLEPGTYEIQGVVTNTARFTAHTPIYRIKKNRDILDE